MWYEESVFYQINLFGFCQVPERNDGVLAHRIQKVTDWRFAWKKNCGLRPLII